MRIHANWQTGVWFVALGLFLSSPGFASDDDWDSEDSSWSDTGASEQDPAVEFHGFVEWASGLRVVQDSTTKDKFLLSEARFRLEAAGERNYGRFTFKGDLLADQISKQVSIDIRQAWVDIPAANWLDFRIGRQVLTWGTGDLVFLNDMFPKDWQSFFIGRDDEYLKAPSTAVKGSIYIDQVQLDLIWLPIFESDRYLTGERLSFFWPMQGVLVGGGPLIDPNQPDLTLKNSEFAMRLAGRLSGVEWAVYGHLGFYKRPQAYDPTAQQPYFSRLGVYGLSLRTPLWGGLLNLEGSFLDSLDDKQGRNPLVPNSQVRTLVGYEFELLPKMTIALQYYLEWIVFHDRLLDRSPAQQFEPDEARHLVTLRWMYRLLRDDLVLSLFAFYSPTDEDAYLRPKIQYSYSDTIKISLGANVVLGANQHTFFGQLENNANVYARIRYSF